jgi:ADP-ribose pyrophosphatase
MNDIPKKIGQERIVYQGNMIELVHHDYQIGDKVKTFELARRAPGTRLIILNEKWEILISKEHRIEHQWYDYRLPGGKVFDTLKEYNTALQNKIDISMAAKEGAVREAEEECGITPQDLELFTISKCGATIEWDLYYFVITEFETLATQQLEAGEDISLERMSKEDAELLCYSENFHEERSAMFLLRYLKKNSNWL